MTLGCLDIKIRNKYSFYLNFYLPSPVIVWYIASNGESSIKLISDITGGAGVVVVVVVDVVVVVVVDVVVVVVLVVVLVVVVVVFVDGIDVVVVLVVEVPI